MAHAYGRTAGGVRACTLGHGLELAVVAHPYLGSMEKVTHDLERLPGWASGLVQLEPASFVRCSITNRVVAIANPVATPAPSATMPASSAAVACRA